MATLVCVFYDIIGINNGGPYYDGQQKLLEVSSIYCYTGQRHYLRWLLRSQAVVVN